MTLPKTVSQNPVASFAIGTLSVQLLVIFTCILVRHSYGPADFSTPAQLSPQSALSQLAEPPALTHENIAPAQPEIVPQRTEKVEEAPLAPASKIVTHIVKPGDTFTKIWTTYGGTVKGAIRASKAIESAKLQVPGIREKEKILLAISVDGDIVQLQRKLKDGRILFLEGNSKDGYKVRISQQNVIEEERIASGTITRSFAAAAEENSVPYAVVNELVDLFSGRIEFSKNVHRGDTFSVIYSERQNSDGEELDPGPIRAASIKVDGKLLVAVRHVAKDGSERYFDELGQPLGNYFLRYPVQFTRISSVFSGARFHPLLQRNRAHNGVDFAAPIGTPVRAVADGVVISAGYSAEGGNMVKIQHGDRYSTAYLHLSRFVSGLRAGMRVKRGEQIGAVGMTGLATGPHLHFSFFDRGSYVNPLTISLPTMPTNAEKIPGEYLQATLRELGEQHQKVQLASAADAASPKV